VKIERQGFAVVDDADRDVGVSVGQICQLAGLLLSGSVFGRRFGVSALHHAITSDLPLLGGQ
jgi:hypothetical protein